MELCRAVYNYEVAKAGDDMKGISATWSTLAGVRVLQYGLPEDSAACGKVSLPTETVGFRRLAETANTTGKDDLSKTVSAKFNEFLQGQQANVVVMANAFSKVADELAVAVSTRQTLPAYRNLAADMELWRGMQSELLSKYMGADRINQSAQAAFNQNDDIKIITPATARNKSFLST
ncbi:hypothetical protein DEA98_29075 (plasmid) [Brucella pseudogrignonensis]|nr:hypothetical protein [Brucella pseudogrignonensis]